MLRRIRLLEYVRARRYATTGRIDLGLHGTTLTWAALRSIGSWRDSVKGLTGASCGPDLVGPGRLTCYSIGTTASADPRGIILPAHDWDGSPVKVIRHSTRRATLPWPEQRLGALEDSEADDCRRTKRSNGHVMLSCKGLFECGLLRVWGFRRLEKV